MIFFGQELIPLLAAILLGAMVGLERQLVGHGAGLRTHIMVALASALFIVISRKLGDPSDPAEVARVIQGIAAGVGFIGAGSILKLGSEHEVIGLTTASTIWLAAAIGTACGLREFSLAAIAAVLSIVVLIALRPIEAHFGKKTRGKQAPMLDAAESA